MRRFTFKQFSFLIALIMFSATTLYAQEQAVTVKLKNAKLEKLFTEIESQSSYRFSYRNSVIENQDLSITINKQNVSVEDLLTEVLGGTTLSFKIISKSSITITDNINDQQIVNKGAPISLSGKVVDDSGLPIVGATVIVKNSSIGTITTIDGAYSLKAKVGDVIECSSIGYATMSYTAADGVTTHNFMLAEESINLDEVVVTALGIKRSEKALGYSVQKVGGDELNVVKGANVASTLTGKVAGLTVYNSSEFAEAPSLELRGGTPLLVIDGVPYANISLNDIASDDIEEMSVLKGATASALYGSRGGDGAIIITTKKGNSERGITVTVNSSTMFEAGFVALPQVQSSYSSGSGGVYLTGDYVWGAKLDAGYTAMQHNPYTQEWENRELTSAGKDNLKNFLQTGLVTNNNVSIAYKGEKGGFRSSLTHVLNKGQYPNTRQNKITYTLGGDIKVNDFTFEGNINYNKRYYPNNVGSGYGGGGFIYNLLVWTGSEYDIMDYKNYWVEGKENIQQNWMTTAWYDNPWFIANEITHENDYHFTNGFVSAKYDVTDDINIMLRSGFDAYSSKDIYRNAMSAIGGWHRDGYYYQFQESGFSTNNDLIATFDKTWGKFNLNLLGGGTLYYYDKEALWAETNNGLTVPGFYSIYASVDPASVGSSKGKKQVNSIYGKMSLSWDNYLFLDLTARNDWSSALPESTRSYFYPSVAASFLLSEVIDLPSYWDMLKLRGSWTKTKSDIDIYDIKNVYSITTNMWDGMNGASYPDIIRPDDLSSQTSTTYELGTSLHWLKNRVWLDFTYYNRLNSDFAVVASMSEASGYSGYYVNSSEVRQRKGVEISIGGDPIRTTDFTWTTVFNWSKDRYIYKELDPVYSSKKPWVQEGERYDWVTCDYMWDTDSEGNIVHGSNGMPVSLAYENVMGYSGPDWTWGFNNSFKYKNLTLNIQFDGRVGGTAYNWTDQALWNSGAHEKSDNQYRYDEVVNNKQTYVGKGVSVASGSIERDAYGNVVSDNRSYSPNDKVVSYESYISSYYWNSYTSAPQSYYDQTFFKLRELSIGYTLPNTLASKLGMKNCSINFVGNNLWLWTKEFEYSDPDKGSDNLNAPSMRYMGFNVTMSF